MTDQVKSEDEKMRAAEGRSDWKSDYEKERAEERDLRKRDVESSIAARTEGLTMNRRIQERNEVEHAIYLKDCERGMELREANYLIYSGEAKDCREHRDRDSAAWERIAAALEKLTK